MWTMEPERELTIVSNQLQSFTTGTAGLVRRLAFQNGDFLSEE
jgi:hypothetical protein